MQLSGYEGWHELPPSSLSTPPTFPPPPVSGSVTSPPAPVSHPIPSLSPSNPLGSLLGSIAKFRSVISSQFKSPPPVVADPVPPPGCGGGDTTSGAAINSNECNI